MQMFINKLNNKDKLHSMLNKYFTNIYLEYYRKLGFLTNKTNVKEIFISQSKSLWQNVPKDSMDITVRRHAVGLAESPGNVTE